MRSLQDMVTIFRDVAKNQNIQGDSAELLIQLLANAAYVSEVENIAYAQEASLEKATLMNSKIQHCMDNMYSVFRGTCPRVYLRFKSNKYISLTPFDEIVSSNNFKVYYLGYYAESGENRKVSAKGTETIALDTDFIYAPKSIHPSEQCIIVGLLAKETHYQSWQLSEENTYYVDTGAEENLSNDMWTKVDGSYFECSRQFSDHIVDNNIFDLTLPSFGSRLYLANAIGKASEISNRLVEAFYYKYSVLSDYNESELRKVNIKGVELIGFDKDEWLIPRGIGEDYVYSYPGLYFIDGGSRENSVSIHYRANRDRFVSSIFRSNSDLGTVLENTYPEKVTTGGTLCKISNNVIDLYYVPRGSGDENADKIMLTEKEKEDFIKNKGAYYVADEIQIIEGTERYIVFNINVELFQSESVDKEINNILSQYERRFNIDFEIDECREEIKSLISKIPNIKQVNRFDIIYTDNFGNILLESSVDEIRQHLDTSYFKISSTINTTLQTNL